MEDDAMDSDEKKLGAQAEFERIAIRLGLMHPGEPTDPALLEYGFRVAELCASIGDYYSPVGKGNAGEHIRARYGLYRVPLHSYQSS
jgi:hypothetical protein